MAPSAGAAGIRLQGAAPLPQYSLPRGRGSPLPEAVQQAMESILASLGAPAEEGEKGMEDGRALPPARQSAQTDCLINEFISGNWPIMSELLSTKDCMLQPT